jgi:flagellar assembly protein FliH
MRSPESDVSVLRAPRIEGGVRRLGDAAAQPRMPPREASAPARSGQEAGDVAFAAAAQQMQLAAEPVVPPELVRAAEQRGYEAGLAKGAEAGRREFDTRLERLDRLLASIEHKRDDLLEVLEDDLVELAFEAIVLIAGDTSLRRDLAVETVRRVLSARPDSHILAVRVAPEDFDLIDGSESAAAAGLGSRIKLQSDPDIRLGGCVIDTAQGSLDARLEVQLDKLRAALLEARSRSGNAEELLPGPVLNAQSASI